MFDRPSPSWPGPFAQPPVYAVQYRIEANRSTYLDNLGRYWLLNNPTKTLEQIGGWPAPLTPLIDQYPPPSKQGPQPNVGGLTG
jgi:hypothetical protein